MRLCHSVTAKWMGLCASSSAALTPAQREEVERSRRLDREAARSLVPTVHSNLLTSIADLVAGCELCGIAIADTAAVAALREIPEAAPLTPDRAAVVARLWRDAGVREAYARRALFQVHNTDSAA